jgi:MerR family transcriptional regulator, aldehyde-responsive regulator
MTIKEVATQEDLTPDTLRYYEKEGLIGPITKTKGGIRNYNDNDIARIRFIKCMRGADLPIDALKKYISLYDMGPSTEKERREILINEREALIERLNRMQKALDRLNLKIKLYDEGKLEYLPKKEK